MVGNSRLVFNYGAVSITGNVRTSNQDSAYVGPNLLVVADGMGGHAGGDIASTITVTTLSPLDTLASPRGILRARMDIKQATNALESAIEQVYNEIVVAVQKNLELSGMGTTITAILRADDSFVTAHLGDSRAYLLHEEELTQLTTDHTFVQHLVDSGKITKEEARVHPRKNVVMRVLGDFDLDYMPDLSFRLIQKGDRYLLSSDGVSGVLDDIEIRDVLLRIEDPEKAARKLVDLAIESGSTDNCTAIVADVVDNRTRSKNYSQTPNFLGAAHDSIQEYLESVIDNESSQVIEVNEEEENENEENEGKIPRIRNIFHRLTRRGVVVED
ncbi:MAG: protein phosphatase 2C domain-containing protein [Candidatus Ancillula sp.]|jgi:protein phosphatase|nr:protein phosphatase 2C domain-containing protein [Candidatus Ancillula sp.]